MDREVVEVVVRFGSTILDVAHVGPTETYRIGTAPDTNLAVPGVTAFPLVDGRTVRCPVGMRAIEQAGSTELSVGALTIHVTRTKLPRTVLARPRVEWRPHAFGLASLVAHLAIWLAALVFAPLERVAAPRVSPLRLARIADVPPPVDEAKRPPRSRASANGSHPPRPHAPANRSRPPGVARPSRGVTSGIEAARSETVASAVSSVAASFDRIDVAKQLGELDPDDAYIPERATGGGFGSGRSFDPSKREGFGSIESGGYATLPFNVKLCPDRSCTVKGPIPALYVRTHLHHHMAAIYDCFAQYADGPGTIVLEFTITADGAVRDARGSGLGETGACAARVAGEIFFKALGSETRVRYPLRFNQPPG